MKHTLKLSAARPREMRSSTIFNTCLLGSLTGLFLLLTAIFAGNVQAEVSSKDGFRAPCTTKHSFNKQSQETSVDRDLDEIFRFDPEWKGNGESPFIEQEDGFTLRKNIGAGSSIFFPAKLDSGTPVVITTKYGLVRQYLVSGETYRGEAAGRYLVYRSENKTILYRYDADKKELREFVYLKGESSLGGDGMVVRWRFEGADISLREDGGASLSRRIDPIAEIRNVADNDMTERIRNFLVKRRGKQPPEWPVEKTLFIIPAPVYVDGALKTRTSEVRYGVNGSELALYIDPQANLLYPLWVDPTLRADADADVILEGQSAFDNFGVSVASAGDFNGDGIDDVIVGAPDDGNNGESISGSAFIFFGGKTGTKRADADADVILEGQSSGDRFGNSVASAGDFNGDGLDDVIVGATGDDNNGQIPSGRAFIFFGGITGTKGRTPTLM
ncbi:MAG: integrin alpha [Candidatus Anammoxibacter sp.]